MVGILGRSAQHIVPLMILVLAVVIWIQNPFDLVARARLQVFDLYQQIEPREFQEVGVRIVDLDDKTLETIGQWPWPRTKVADMVAQLARMGAAAIVFDIVFAEPDRTSPEALTAEWSTIPQYKRISAAIQEQSDLPRHDDLLASIFAHPAVPVVTGFVLSAGDLPRQPIQKNGEAFGGDNPRQFISPQYSGAVANLVVLEEAAKGNGSFNVVPDNDGTVRRAPMIVALRTGDDPLDDVTLYPALSMEALRVVQRNQDGRTPPLQIKSSGASGVQSFGAQTGVESVRIGQFIVPTNSRGEMWVHYTRPVQSRYIPAYQLFDPDTYDVQPKIAGHIVLIGTSAAGLKDIRKLPLNPVAPGVVVHANILEQILTNSFLERPAWMRGVELTYMIVLALFLALTIPRIGAIWGAVIGGLALAIALGFSWVMYSEHRLLVDPVYASLVAFLVYLAASFIKYLREEHEKETIRGAFSMYLSPALVSQLAEHPNQLVLGGEMRDMTLLFADIRGFTTISEQFRDPRDLIAFINRFLTPMTQIIMERRGTIDKYMGDCIMAFWNAPLDDDRHALNACRSALAMCKGRDDLNAILKREAEAEDRRFIPVDIGIGLNSDTVCVGNMGSSQRFDYSVLGDGVNLASRLEGQSKTYGVDIVIGPHTNTEAENAGLATVELDLIQVKGKTVPVNIFALLGEEREGAREAFKALKVGHDAMIAAYRTMRFDKAEKLLSECRKFGDKRLDRLYELYAQRIAEYKQNPPPPDWDGAYIATSK